MWLNFNILITPEREREREREGKKERKKERKKEKKREGKKEKKREGGRKGGRKERRKEGRERERTKEREEERKKEKREKVEPSRSLWGSWAQKPFCVPCSLFVGNRLQTPWPSLSPKGQIQTVANQGREGIPKTREEQPRNNSAALGQGPGSASRDTHSNIFELFCRAKIPNKWKMLTTWWSILHSREKVTAW